jgi:hypothetical protein
VSVRTNSESAFKSAALKSTGGITLPGTICDGFLKCGTSHATLRWAAGILVRSGPMPFWPAPGWQPSAALLLEDSQAGQFFRVKRCQAASGRGEPRRSGFLGELAAGRRLPRSFGGRRFRVVRRFLILGRGDNRGGGQAGPGNGGEKHKRDRKCSLSRDGSSARGQ